MHDSSCILIINKASTSNYSNIGETNSICQWCFSLSHTNNLRNPNSYIKIYKPPMNQIVCEIYFFGTTSVDEKGLVLSMRGVPSIDDSAIHELDLLVHHFRSLDTTIVFSGVQENVKTSSWKIIYYLSNHGILCYVIKFLIVLRKILGFYVKNVV